MKFVSLLLCLLVRDGQTTSEPGIQSSSSDSFHQTSPDSSFEEFKRRGWGKRSPLDEGTASQRATDDRSSSALSEGEEDTDDANESTIADLVKSIGRDNAGPSLSPEICDEMDFNQMMEKRRGWGKRDLLLEKRRGWGKRDLKEEDKRRGWGKRAGDWVLEEKRRGWGKRDVIEKRRGWGKRDTLKSVGEQISNEAKTCPTILQALHYHGCLAMKVTTQSLWLSSNWSGL